jgi:hypothetical protein
MNTNITKTWNITISAREVFARCTNESLNHVYNRATANPKGDAVALMLDDESSFSMYFDFAIAKLHTLLARRMEEPPIPSYDNDSHGVTFVLGMHQNHDNNMLPILIANCYDYVVKIVLEQWFHIDLGSELARLEVNHCLHYRKNPVRRRFSPLV